MKLIESGYLFGIFDYLNYQDEGESSYYLINFFGKGENYSSESLNEVFKDVLHKNIDESLIGPFSDLEELKNFAFKLCQAQSACGVVLVSKNEYNIHLEKSSDFDELFSYLYESGERMENLERGPDKKGIFDKLFH